MRINPYQGAGTPAREVHTNEANRSVRVSLLIAGMTDTVSAPPGDTLPPDADQAKAALAKSPRHGEWST